MKYRTQGLETRNRIEGLLNNLEDEEWVAHKPLSYNLEQIFKQLGCSRTPPKREIIAGFRSLGFNACQTYYDQRLWKTNAPPQIVYDVAKSYKRQHCVSWGVDYLDGGAKLTQTTHQILNHAIKLEANFNADEVIQSNRNKKALRDLIHEKRGES